MLYHGLRAAFAPRFEDGHYLERLWFRTSIALKASKPAPGSRAVARAAASLKGMVQQQVQKPLCDRRSYQQFVLENGLRVLAIQDTDAVFAAVCANVQAGYFDDLLPGAAHFLEHMVHLGSDTFPDEREYKAFLAAHGGSSNASTSMVHTRYHFKVHASALAGALSRLGAALACPLLAEESAAREVENVHAEYSRNTNSDSRQLLQLKRSLHQPPYSGFSTGSITTLWEDPKAAGVSVPGVLRQLWETCYAAEATTVAVVGPQETQELLRLVQDAFGSMRHSGGTNKGTRGSNGGSSTAGHTDQVAAAKTGGARAGAGAAAGAGAGAAADLYGSRGSSCVSLSNAGEDSDIECSSGTATAAAAAAGSAGLEAVVHSNAQQELQDPTEAEVEPCSQIAAVGGGHHHHHHHQQQQQQHTLHRQHGLVQQPHRYPVDVCGSVGQYVRVCPQRDLREVQVMWYIPAGAITHSSTKPWHLASHLLGHEVPGSVAHLLKAQCLIQSLSVGMADEVRLGRGWMFWGATLTLTQEGEERLEHVLATLMRGVQVLQGCSDAQLQQHWQECATLAALRFDWKDQAEPLAAAQAAAYALHYYPPHQVLSGPSLMTSYDVTPVRWFLEQLSPSSMNVFWSSRRHKGHTGSKEPFYGAHYTAEPLPPSWLDTFQAYAAVDASSTNQEQRQADAGRTSAAAPQQQQQQRDGVQQQFVPLPGELYLPPQNWAIPTDFELRPQEAHQPAGPDATTAAAAAAEAAGAAAAESAGGALQPDSVVQQPGLCVWHKLDTSYGLPKVYLKLHIVTPAVYATPRATVSARLLVRVLDDLLLPTAYPAELAGTTYSLSTGQGGLLLKVTGFQGVAQQLMEEVLAALKGLTREQVAARFSTMHGRLTQGLTNWANNNPAQHSEYAAHHLLQQHHHHNRDLLIAAAAAQPQDITQLQQQLVSGADMHLDMLAYGNISSSEAAHVASRVHKLLPAQGLVNPDSWPPLGMVYSLSSSVLPQGRAEEDSGRMECEAGSTASSFSRDVSAAAAAGSGPVCVTYLPDNPNPSNSNHAVYYWVQLGPDDVSSSVLSDLFVQMSSKPAFHELRTRQRLGYSVHLRSSSLQRQLGLVVGVQSPGTAPDAVVSAVRTWMAGFRGELQQLAQGKLDSHKQSLLDKYMEPPKSLHEAAHRAWLPIGSSRTLVFDRQQQKAAALQAITQQQLLNWYDLHVDPNGQKHQALCVHLWGGVAAAPADAVAAALHGPGCRAVAAGEVDMFKQAQQILPQPKLQLPAAAPTQSAL